MSRGPKAARRRRDAAFGGEDHLSALPDELLQKVLSLLPSREAVQTSVLARRWRDQWKGVLSLRATDDEDYESANELNKFINYLLVLRNQSLPLDVVDIKSYHGFGDNEDTDEECRYIGVWIQYALEHKVQDLRVCITSDEIVDHEDNRIRWPLPNMLITSKFLRKLELIRVSCEGHSLDFSSCPLLKYLKMEFCEFKVSKLSSSSLKHWIFTYCYFEPDIRTQISAPSLIYLELVDCKGRTPFLESMPLLVSAFVRLRNCDDNCTNSYEIGDCGDDSCDGCTGNNIGNDTTSVLLQGLSSSTNLELTAQKAVFIFRKDLTRCPVFSNLKTLLLNDWCITANLDPLICFLQHSPTLEKLTIQLPEIHEDLVDTAVIYDTTMKHFLKRLTVEVKCYKQDVLVHKILKALDSCGVPSEQIKILQPPKHVTSRYEDPWPSGSFSFEQVETGLAVGEAASSDSSVDEVTSSDISDFTDSHGYQEM